MVRESHLDHYLVELATGGIAEVEQQRGLLRMARVPKLATREAQVAVDAARAAGKVISDAFHRPKAIEHKGSADLVTETDKACELLIMSAIRENFPDHKFIGEEETSAAGAPPELTDNPTWMVDPVDGTTNFVHCWPFCCVSIALVVKKEVMLGVVYNPVLEEMFVAEKGHGAFLNGEKISVSSTKELGNALLATELGTHREGNTLDFVFNRIRKLSSMSRSLRCNGSCAIGLCGVACGRLDVFYEIGFGGCWDAAAGALMVKEAGGKILDPAGTPVNLMSRRILATNAHLDQAVSEVIKSCGIGNLEPQPL